MRVLILLLSLSIYSGAQIGAPQVPVTGNIGSGGVFPLLNNGLLVFSFDADRTMQYPEMSAAYIVAASSVPLTTTRKLIAPLATGFMFTITNATMGGQPIQIIGTTGGGVTIANSQTVTVVCNGFGYLIAEDFPASGVAVSTGVGGPWTTSLQVGAGANNLVQLNGSGALPAVSGENLTSLNGANLQNGSVANAALANSGININSTNCVLGIPCSIATGGLPSRTCNANGCYMQGADGTLIEWVSKTCPTTTCFFTLPLPLTSPSSSAAACSLFVLTQPNVITEVFLNSTTQFEVEGVGVVEVGGSGSAYTGGGIYNCIIIGF
jgi:hypothetical protein